MFSSFAKDEKIVATNCDMGILFVEELKDDAKIYDADSLDIEDLPENIISISVKYIADPHKIKSLDNIEKYVTTFDETLD